MAKHRDITGAGRSRIIPRLPGESWRRRHGRRLIQNARHEAEVRAWCEHHGISLRVTNGQHHWQFRRGSRLAEWWPSSAKLIFEKQWHRGIHCHDYQQVMATIARCWKL